MRNPVVLLLVLAGLIAGGSVARAGEEPVPADVEQGCAVVAEGISFLTGFLVGKPFGEFGTSLGTHLATKYGADAVNQKCKNYYSALDDQKNLFDYERFVQSVCGGNPLTCPNGWNAMQKIPNDPFGCHMYIVCNIALAVGSDNSLRVQDMLNAAAFIDLSHRAGYWDYQNFGYLVGVSGLHADSGAGLSFDTR